MEPINSMSSCQDDLRRGLRVSDKSGCEILYRYLTPTDDVEAITRLLHDAYAPLAVTGMRFLASHQDSEVTRRRMAKGETFVADEGGNVLGVVTLADMSATSGSPFYDRPGVARLGQFAVRPSKQRLGIGSTLMGFVERRAAEQGVAELALDTSEHAAHLIAFYEARGYRFVEHCQWEVTNYRSMVLAKRLRQG